jgi:DNA-binding transcriptional MocR family regulator
MYNFSRKVNSEHSEDIKALMQHAVGKHLISFAGGMPNNDLFPVKEIDEIYNGLSDEIKRVGFQYGPTSGYPPLVRNLKTYLKNKGLPIKSNKILITTGSLQAISIITQELINEGDVILTENPSFVGALSVFETYRANVIGIPIDEHGIIIDELKSTIDKFSRKPKFLYITPNFHNPAGIIYSLERKRQILEVLDGTGIILLEDDAYSDLYFSDEGKVLTKPIKSIEGYDVEVIYTGSFSKILGPGFRLGWMLASPMIYEKGENIKQALDACTSNFNQILANEFLAQGKLATYLEFLRVEYLERKNLLQNALIEYMPKEIVWSEPKGGFYIWIKLPKNLNSTDIFKKCIEKNVVFVTGRTFDPASKKDDRLRLAFSNMPKDEIKKGVEIIAEVIKSFL